MGNVWFLKKKNRDKRRKSEHLCQDFTNPGPMKELKSMIC